LRFSLPAFDPVDRHANRCVFFDQQEGRRCDSLPLVLLWSFCDGQKVQGRPENEKNTVVTGESDHIVAELAARIFADFADPQTISRLDDGAWKTPF